MSDRRYWEDFEVGDVIEFGSRTLSKEEIIAFAKEYDPQPFHIDEEAAKDTIFQGLAASGWQTGAIYMRMLVDDLLSKTVSMGSPGVEEMRWLKPVRPGDTLRARFTVLEANASKSRPNMGVLRSKAEVLNQSDEVVMSLVAIGFFGRRPS